MITTNDSIVINRIENIANKVYRGNKNAVYMLVNDLEEIFEINNSTAEKMTTEDFAKYIERIKD